MEVQLYIVHGYTQQMLSLGAKSIANDLGLGHLRISKQHKALLKRKLMQPIQQDR